jgi:hypothetical protein
MTWDGLKTDPENGVVMNLNTAYLDAKGEYDIHTIHTSYLIPNVMKMKNFNIYLGAYASWVNASPKAGDKKNDDRYGGRVRFKYSFYASLPVRPLPGPGRLPAACPAHGQ